MAGRVDEYVAYLLTSHPGRFGDFATVPLPDVEGAVSEAGHALDWLGWRSAAPPRRLQLDPVRG